MHCKNVDSSSLFIFMQAGIQMPPRFGIHRLLSFLLLVSAAFAQSQQNRPWDSPAFTATPQTLLEAASGVVADKSDDSIVLLQEDHYTFDAQGRAVHTHRVVGKIVTAGGVDQWKNLSAQYEPW